MDSNLITAASTFGLTIITFFLALFTYKLWQSTNKTIKDNKEFYHNQLKAYIGVDNFEIKHNTNNNKIQFLFSINNYGQTLATNVNVSGSMQILPFPLPETLIISKYTTQQNVEAIIFPNVSKNSPQISMGFEFNATANQVEEIFKNLEKNRLYIYINIKYLDIFKNERQTLLGYYYNYNNNQGKFTPLIGENSYS